MSESVKNDIFSNEILYVPVDHTFVTKFSLYDIAETFHQEGVKLLCFDEIHKYANWSQELKSMYDVFTDLKIINSGSSAIEIYKSSHDLSRRAIIYTMKGMSFREFVELTMNLKLEPFLKR